MGLRETLNRHPAVAGILVVAALAGAAFFLVRGRRSEDSGPPLPKGLWFYDLQTGRLFADAIDRIPPFQAPSGGEAVLAMVFTCKESCGGHDLAGKTAQEIEELGLFVGYLQRLSQAAKARLEELKRTTGDAETVMLRCMEALPFEGEFREVNDTAWSPPRSEKMQQLHERLRTRCGSTKQYPRQCNPGD